MENKANRTIMICVRNPRHCETLLQAAKVLAKDSPVRLQVLAVRPMTASEAEMVAFIETIHSAARDYGAEINIIFDNNPIITAAQHIFHSGCRQIITGMPSENANGFVHFIRELIPEMTISMVSEEGITYNLFPHCHPVLQEYAV